MFPQRWIPANIGILAEGFTVENKLMNPTYKIIRPKVEKHYKELFEFLYTPDVQRPDGKVVSVYYFCDKRSPERYIAVTIWDVQ